MNRVAHILSVLIVPAFFSGCTGCIETPTDAGVDDGVGQIYAVTVDDGVELRLASLKTPLRVLEVEFTVDASALSGAVAAGTVLHDVVEVQSRGSGDVHGLVVSDTRRILLDDGAVARLTLSAATSFSLGKATAIDDDGAAVRLEIGAAP